MSGRTTVRRISLGEDIRFGQQAESGVVEVRESGGGWEQVLAFGTIGHKRILALDTPVSTDEIRVRILQSRAKVRLAQLSVF